MSPLRILVIRNDKLGDFMLAWPALALLKQSIPDALITLLVPSYTRELAEVCPWADEVIQDPEELYKATGANFDAVLTLFSTGRIGWQVFKGRIPLRVAPATKLAQVFYNKRVVQRRSRSEKPEYVYNLELAELLIESLGPEPVSISAPFWPRDMQLRAEQRKKLADDLNINPADEWFFVHAGSGGSANNLSTDQYTKLIKEVSANVDQGSGPVSWLLTCGPGEKERAEAISANLDTNIRVSVFESKAGLEKFADCLLCADLLIAGSTGPLHLAGAMNVPTVGFYPARRSATALRWRPCNSEGRTLGISAPDQKGDGQDMSGIDIDEAAKKIARWYMKL